MWSMYYPDRPFFSNLLKIHFCEIHHFFIILNLKNLTVIVQHKIYPRVFENHCLYYVLD